MKIRAGFVSNSSSSSFVFILPRSLDTSSLETLHDYLYGPEGTTLSLERYDDTAEEMGVDAIWDTELAAAFEDVRAASETEAPSVTPSGDSEPALPEDLLIEDGPARPTRLAAISSHQAAEAVWQRLRGHGPNEERALLVWAGLIGGGPSSDALDRYIGGEIRPEAYEERRLRYIAAAVAYAHSRMDELVGPDNALYMVEFTDWGGDDLDMIMRSSTDNLGVAKRWELSIG